MINRRAFAQLLAAGLAAPAAAPAVAAPPGPVLTAAAAGTTLKGRAAEVLALRKFAEKTSPRGLEAAADADWIRRWHHLQQQADALDDGAYVIELRRALAWFREAHTTIVPFEFLGSVPPPLAGGVWGLRLPLKAMPFHDGLWITETSTEARALLGTRIQSINGQGIQKITAEHARSWPGENPAWAHNWAGLLASSPGTLRGLGVTQGSIASPLSLDCVSSEGVAATLAVSAQSGSDHGRIKLARSLTRVEQFRAEAGVGNFIKSLPGVLYVSIDDMADLKELPFAQFTDNVLSNMRAESVERIVIDLRRNGGGDNYLGEPLRHELARSRFNAPGKLCVLIGPATFSAAQNFANRIERECFATFVGEPTGSAPNLVGDAAFHVGQATGITAMVATKRWFDGGPDDKRRWIFPDVFVPSLYADWAAGRDPALDAALSLKPSGANTFAARIRYFERDSQKARWTPFWNPA
jgi:hypothetical protein